MTFDPYSTWLSIPPDRRPPSYYDLLGLNVFESDPTIIDQAALRRIGKVRQYQLGPQSDLSQQILAEIARARLLLIDPDRKADYDAKLRAGGNPQRGPSPVPQPFSSNAPRQTVAGDSPPEKPIADELEVLGSLNLNEVGSDGSSAARKAKTAVGAGLLRWTVRGLAVSVHVVIFLVVLSYLGILEIPGLEWQQPPPPEATRPAPTPPLGPLAKAEPAKSPDDWGDGPAEPGTVQPTVPGPSRDPESPEKPSRLVDSPHEEEFARTALVAEPKEVLKEASTSDGPIAKARETVERRPVTKLEMDLRKAKNEYDKNMKKFESSMLEYFDKEAVTVQKAKSLDVDLKLKLLEVMKKEKEAFARHRRLPFSLLMKQHTLGFLIAISRENKTLNVYYRRAIDYFLKKDPDRAKDLDMERKAVFEPWVIAVWECELGNARSRFTWFLFSDFTASPNKRNRWEFSPEGLLVLYNYASGAPGGVWIDRCTLSEDGLILKAINQKHGTYSGKLSVPW